MEGYRDTRNAHIKGLFIDNRKQLYFQDEVTSKWEPEYQGPLHIIFEIHSYNILLNVVLPPYAFSHCVLFLQ